jgi:hypothetical protein
MCARQPLYLPRLQSTFPDLKACIDTDWLSFSMEGLVWKVRLMHEFEPWVELPLHRHFPEGGGQDHCDPFPHGCRVIKELYGGSILTVERWISDDCDCFMISRR